MATLEQELANYVKNIKGIGDVAFEMLPEYSKIKKLGKKFSKRINPYIYTLDAYAVYKETGKLKNAIARFTADVAGGVVTTFIVVSGVETMQPELIAVSFFVGDITEKVVEEFSLKCLTFLDTHILTPIQETIHNFLIRTFIEPVVHQIMQWTPNPLAPFSLFGYNTSDDISFVYAYAVFKDSHYKHNAYSHSTPTYAYNTYTQERVNALSQGFSSLASDVSTHNIVISDSNISHCFDTLLYRELESLYKDYMAYTPIALDNGYKIGNIKASYLQRIPQEDIQSLTPNSPLHLLKALFFCEDYILLDSNKEPLLKESNWREFYNYKSDFYTIFIADKQTLTKDYINKRKSLYKAIMQIRKEQQDKEIQELQRQQQELEQQLQGLDSKVRESKLQELQRKQERELREKQREKERQEQRQSRFSKNLANTYNTSITQNLTTNNNAYITKDSYLVLESNDKNNVIIFLDSISSSHNTQSTISHLSLQDLQSKSWQSNNSLESYNISLSNLIHIHNERIDIFTKDNTRLDIQELESLIKEYSKSFRDSSNTESNFIESKANNIESNPIHNTQSDNNNIESKTNNVESNNQESKLTLDSLHSANTQIFLYSQLLLGSSETPNNPLFFGELDKEGVFVESKPIYHLIGEIDYDSKDSKESFTQTLQVFLGSNTLTLLNYSLLDSSLNIKLECNSSESKAIQEKEKAQRDKDSSPLASNDKSQSTAMLHPILEDDEIKCPHNGVVKLKSNKGKPFTSKGIPMILESDLLHSSIIGCTNPLLSGGPCTMVATILPNARGLKKFNDDYPIMQDLCISGVMSDKGFPLICTPKENTFRINSPNPSNANTQSKEALLATIKLTKPLLRLYYKEHIKQIDNIPVHRCKINDILQESDTPFGLLELDIHKDSKDLQDTDLQAHLQASYPKDYEFKEIDVTIGIHRLALIFIIRQTIPKVYKQAYKEYEYKEYGVGIYKQLLEYSKDIQHNKESIENKENSLQSIVITHTRVFLAPYGAKKLSFEFANGLDSIIEEKEGVLKIHLINQIVKKVYNG